MTEIKIETITEEMEKFKKETFSGAFKHISYHEKMEKSIDELMGTNPKEIIKWGWKVWDDTLGGIYGGKIYVIGAESGAGKSTFVNQVTMNLSRQGVKVTKYALEDRLEDIGKEELFYMSNRILKKEGKKMFDWNSFNNGEYTSVGGKFFAEENKKIVYAAKEYLEKLRITELDKEKQVGVKDLIKLMEEEVEKGTKVFFIDHLHYFKMNGNERTDLEIQNIMHDINEVTRKHNVSVFLVAHYKKLNGMFPDNDSFKDASAVKQVANIIIHIVRNENNTEFHIGKIRGPIRKRIIEAKFDIGTYTYQDFIYKDF